MVLQFKIRYQKKDEPGLIFSINYQKLNIVILSMLTLPGPVTMDEPDREMEVKAYDPYEVFLWAWFAAKQKQTISFG